MAAALLLGATGCGDSSGAPFKIGVLADCTGIVGATHDWSLAAAELPLLQHGGRLAGKGPGGGVQGAKVAGRRIEIVEGCSETGVYGRLINETRQLVEVDHVDAVVGGFGFSDGIVFRELARRYPTVPFLLVVSAVREATVHRPAANLYRFVPDIEQGTAGLATYAYRTLGWRHAAVVAEYTANGWGGASAFTREFCALGGTTKQIWTTELGYGPAKPLLQAGSGLGRRHGRALGIRVVREPGAVHPGLARAARRCPALAAARALDVPAPGYGDLCIALARRSRRGGAAGRHPRPVLVVGRGLPQGLRSRHFPACRRASRATSTRGRTRLRWKRCCKSLEKTQRSARRGARRLARGARLASGSTPRGAACASTAIARPSYR